MVILEEGAAIVMRGSRFLWRMSGWVVWAAEKGGDGEMG
jgi:hypothetical protein